MGEQVLPKMARTPSIFRSRTHFAPRLAIYCERSLSSPGPSPASAGPNRTRPGRSRRGKLELLSAFRTVAEKLYPMPDDGEAAEEPPRATQGVQGRVDHILNAPTSQAHQVVMRRGIGFETKGAVLPAFDADQLAMFTEGRQGLVDRIQRDHRETPLHLPVDLVHGGMAPALGEGLKDRHALGGNTEPPGAQAEGYRMLGPQGGRLEGWAAHGGQLTNNNGYYLNLTWP